MYLLQRQTLLVSFNPPFEPAQTMHASTMDHISIFRLLTSSSKYLHRFMFISIKCWAYDYPASIKPNNCSCTTPDISRVDMPNFHRNSLLASLFLWLSKGKPVRLPTDSFDLLLSKSIPGTTITNETRIASTILPIF